MQLLTKGPLIALVAVTGWLMLVTPEAGLAQYQGEVSSGQVLVDKKVRSLVGNLVADNLDKSQKVFIEGETIEFIVDVENTSRMTLKNIAITDRLPAYLKLVFYPGTYDVDKGIITWEIEELTSGEKKQFTIRAIITGVPNWHDYNSPKIMENVVTSLNDGDSSKYYVAAKTVPGTGDQELWVKTGVVILMGLSGLGLRKYARGY